MKDYFWLHRTVRFFIWTSVDVNEQYFYNVYYLKFPHLQIFLGIKLNELILDKLKDCLLTKQN